MDLAGVERSTSVVCEKEGRYSTAHVYKNALLSFSLFCGTFNVSFRQVTRERLRRYGQYLYECGLKPNTVSTYMRMLRSIYNRGVEAGSAPTSPACFTMSIRVWMFVRRRPFLLPSCGSCFMKIPNRNVYAIHRLLPL